MRMARDLEWFTSFHWVSEPATLDRSWTKRIAEFKWYVTTSGVENKLQKRALLLHLAGPGVREIFKIYLVDILGDENDFDKAVTCLTNHFKFKKNVPLA